MFLVEWKIIAHIWILPIDGGDSNKTSHKYPFLQEKNLFNIKICPYISIYKCFFCNLFLANPNNEWNTYILLLSILSINSSDALIEIGDGASMGAETLFDIQNKDTRAKVIKPTRHNPQWKFFI